MGGVELVGYVWVLLVLGGRKRGKRGKREVRGQTCPSIGVVAKTVEEDECCWVRGGGGRGDSLRWGLRT